MRIEDLSKKVCDIRKKKGLSQYNLWKRGMNLMTARAVEEGKNVTIETLIKYCELIGAEITIKEKEER